MSIRQTTLWALSIWGASSCSASPSSRSSSCLLVLLLALVSGFPFPRSLWAQAVFENPPPGSFQSGLGVISGWVCEAERIDIVFNAGTDAEVSAQAAYGTDRADTRPTCGDSNNGFGLLFNWNLLGDGTHTVHARADGEIFGSATVTVSTLGQEFLTGASGEFVVKGFPTADDDITLRWQQSIQNFVLQGGTENRGGHGGTAPRVLENPAPGSFQSGLGVISGWVCEAERIDIVFNAGTDAEVSAQAAYGTNREDTRPGCGDSDNGFGLLFNWNLLGDGTHTVHARADGEIFGSATVTVTALGREFLAGVEKRAQLKDFPDPGTDLVVAWQQTIQNFVILGAAPVEPPQYAAPVRVTGPLGRNEDGEQFSAEGTPGDVNGDGHEDVVLQLWAGDLEAPKLPTPIVVLVNDGAGSLVDGTADVIAGPIPEVFVVRQFIIEDFNGDGQNDIFMSNHGREDKPEHFDGEQNRLLLSGPDGRLRDVTAQNLPQVSDFSHGSSAADVDGDGDIDVWVNNLGGGEAPSYLLLNDGGGVFSIVADIGYPVPDFRGRERIVGTNDRLPDVLIGSYPFWTHFLDVENDGDADLYLGLIENVENPDGSQSDRTGILLNDGTGRFTLSDAAAIPPPLIGGTGQAQDSVRADLNQDGLYDLLLYQSDQMFRGHFIQVLISNGDGSFRDETALRLPEQVNAFQGGGAPIFWFRDINGDGHNEILNFLYVPGFATNFIDSYLNMGNGIFTSLPDDFVEVDLVATVDVNGDGWVDFLDVKYEFNLFGEAELFLTTAINPNDLP